MRLVGSPVYYKVQCFSGKQISIFIFLVLPFARYNQPDFRGRHKEIQN